MPTTDRYRIGKIHLGITNPTDAQQRIIKSISQGGGTYVCVSNPRTINYACRDAEYLSVMCNSLINLPDAQPTVWAARLWGLKQVERTMGPTLFQNMLFDTENGIWHFLLGDTEDTLNEIQKITNARNAKVAGCFSPPFCNVDEYDYEGIAQMINSSGANIVWISMRAPKQDLFAVRLRPFLNGQVCVGVGAAFRFLIGEYKMAPPIIKKLGLMGLFWGRKGQPFFKFIFGYLRDNIPYLWLLAKIPYWRLMGKKYYE